ncbi:MAG: hypothetical protein Q8P06_01715 [Candidatus Azambacteria bacterium]|nr:hypothetical protein [Candidatus Azambacteria bacterium]
MDNSSSNKYLSLKTAAGLYGYTRDHLGLMIRQDKLKGTKIGSYYVTTGEWMADYIKKFADPKHPASRNKLSNKFLKEIFSAGQGSPKQNSSEENSVASNGEINSNKKLLAPITLHNARENTAKRNDVNGDLAEIILKELAHYKLPAVEEAPIREAIMPYSGAPMIILPIRKMEDAERECVLKKVEPN